MIHLFARDLQECCSTVYVCKYKHKHKHFFLIQNFLRYNELQKVCEMYSGINIY